MKKNITVVVPAYNMEEYLNRCLDSLIVDNMDLLEVLVIDDGSTDKTYEIAKQYEIKYPSVFRVITKNNGHYGSCINVGLKEAKGKYFKVLDADDYYDTENFLKLINALNTEIADIILTPYNVWDENICRIRDIINIHNYKDPLIDIGEIDSNFIEMNPILSMHGMTVKTDMLRSNNYWQTEGILYTDYLFYFYSMMYAKNFSIYNFKVYQYCRGRSGQSVSKETKAKHYKDFMDNAIRMHNEYITFTKNTTNKYLRLEKYIHIALFQYFYILHSKYGMDKCLEIYELLDPKLKEYTYNFYFFNKS